MSIIVYLDHRGKTIYGQPWPDSLIDLIIAHNHGRYLPGGSRIAYRLRIKEKPHA